MAKKGINDMRQTAAVVHPIAPVYDKNSKILILGSFPSVKSREQMFFYGHKQNRFWKVLAALLECPLPQTIEQKRQMLLAHGIALWDVIASCEIAGSSDAAIRNVIPNDLTPILETAHICGIFLNGGKAYELFEKHQRVENPAISTVHIAKLPSTSPANAAFSLERLIQEWMKIKDFL